MAIDPDDGTLTLIAAVEADDPDTRMNDGKVDPAGRFWAGTMFDHEGPGGGALYRLDADLRVTEMLRPVSIANGLDWTDDGREMLYIDTDDPAGRPHRVRRRDRGPGRATAVGRPSPTAPAHPDGMTLDAEGCAWVALWGAPVRRALLTRGRADVAHRRAGRQHQQLHLRRPGPGPAVHHHGPVARPATAAPGAGGLYVAAPVCGVGRRPHSRDRTAAGGRRSAGGRGRPAIHRRICTIRERPDGR